MLRQGILHDGAVVGQVRGKFQHVAQLPHVARPVVDGKAAQSFVGDGDGALELLGQLGQQRLRQGGDVLPPLPQGRYVQADGGDPVKEVNSDLFSENNKIETVDVQAQITSIRFRDCAALREVTLPVTINEIETRSFYNTPALERVTVDKACVIDGDWSYSTVPEIHYVELSEGVGDSTQVEMKAEHNYYTADGRFQFQYTDQGLIIKKYIGTDSEVTVPEKIQGYPVTDIVREAFSGNNMIEKVTINAKLQDIGDVFRDNEALREVVVPSSVKSIGYLAFYNTPALSTITVASDCVVSSQCAGYDVNLTINYTE